MKTFEKISMLAIGLALITGLLSCKPEVEYIEKPVEKEYAKAVTFESTASEGKVTVTLKTETEDAVIYYTIDGKTIPSAESTKYTEALTCTEDTVIMAIAVKEGVENSPISYAKVSIKEKKIIVEKIIEPEEDKTAPAAPTNLTATAKDCKILLLWTDATDADVYGYEVSYSGTTAINRAATALGATSMMAPQGAGGCYVSGLTNGTEYTFTVKTVDTSGNKSEGVTATATPVAPATGETLQIALSASVPNTNKLGEAYTGTKSNTNVTVTANITSASTVKKVVFKKNGSVVAKTLLADTAATTASVDTSDNSKWTFTISATDETANGTYTVAVIDNAGREEAEQITIDQFDFTPPSKVTGVSGNYENSQITLSWTAPADADYDHVAITYTYNDGTSDSQPSQAVSVAKDTLTKTFENIHGTAKYYTFSLVSVDLLGNTSEVRNWKVGVAETVNNCPDGFVEVTGATVEGPVSGSNVFKANRTVTIGNLYVSAAEVTQKEYETYCESIPITSYPKGDNYPAYFVNWYDAIVYCNLRTIAELSENDCVYSINGEKDPRKWEGIVGSAETKYCGPSSSTSTWDYKGTDDTDGGIICDITKEGYRLPTEVEWEYIARGGNNGIPETQTTYSGSNTIDDVAWYKGNSGGKQHEVKTDKVPGKDSANTLGIYDMTGNVSEWCWDWYNPISSTRVSRGGSWDDYADNCTVSYYYNGVEPDTKSFSMGFRVVRTAN